MALAATFKKKAQIEILQMWREHEIKCEKLSTDTEKAIDERVKQKKVELKTLRDQVNDRSDEVKQLSDQAHALRKEIRDMENKLDGETDRVNFLSKSAPDMI